MPRKDKQSQLAYQRELYHRNEELRTRVIEKVRWRKLEVYGGTCRFCGAKTYGQSKKNPGSDLCGRGECRSAHNREKREVFAAAGRKGRAVQMGREVAVMFNHDTGRWEDAA